MNTVKNVEEFKMPADVIRVFVNGEPQAVPAGQTVAAMLTGLKVPAERVAVELNRTIVRKRDWETTPVGAEAQLEIVEFVGGG